MALRARHAAIETRRSRESNYQFLAARNARELLRVVGVEKHSLLSVNRLLINFGLLDNRGACCCAAIFGHLLAGRDHLTQFADTTLRRRLTIDDCTFDAR